MATAPRLIVPRVTGHSGSSERASRLVAGAGLTAIATGMAFSKGRQLGPAACADDLSHELYADEQRTVALFEKCSASVVHVNTFNREAVFRDMKLSLQEIRGGTGSGFVWDEDHIVTNFHVILNADRASVVLADGTTCEAKIAGIEPDSDLAVLKLERGSKRLVPLERGNSTKLHVGQKVLAIGNPFGLDQTLTSGIVSGLGREMQSVSGRPIRDLIQTDAAINPGNSGGPLLDARGRLIGVNTMIASPSGAFAGVGFAIPVNTVVRVASQLVKYGHTKRAYMGIMLAPPHVRKTVNGLLLQVGAKQLQGALVLAVEDGGPANFVGIRGTERRNRGLVLGDEILELNGKTISSEDALLDALEEQEVGKTVSLKIRRRNASRSGDITVEDAVLRLTLSERPQPQAIPGTHRGGAPGDGAQPRFVLGAPDGEVRSRL